MNELFFLYRNFTDLAGTDGLSVAKVQPIFLRTRRPFVLQAIKALVSPIAQSQI